MRKSLLRKLLLTALFTALSAAGAMLHIGDASFQTLFAAMSGILLGPVWGPVSQLLYVALGLMGLPLFLEGGGPMYVVHPTFGFLLGMILSSFLTGILTEKTKWNIWLVSALGLLSVYVIGTPYLYGIFRYYRAEEMTFAFAAMSVAVYLPIDVVKLFLVAIIGERLLPVVRKDLYD